MLARMGIDMTTKVPCDHELRKVLIIYAECVAIWLGCYPYGEMRTILHSASIGYFDLNSDSVMSDLLLLVVPPKASIIHDLNTDSRLENPKDSIIQILGIIRNIPRKGKGLPHQLPL